MSKPGRKGLEWNGWEAFWGDESAASCETRFKGVVGAIRSDHARDDSEAFWLRDNGEEITEPGHRSEPNDTAYGKRGNMGANVGGDGGYSVINYG